MEFKVTFTTGSGGYAVAMPVRSAGLNDLDWVREELGVPHLDPARVRETIPEEYSAPTITITEEQARESGLFLEACRAVVVVPMASLNKYLYVQVEEEKDPETGEIIWVKFKNVLDKEALIRDWLSAGAPREWGLAEVSEEEDEEEEVAEEEEEED